MFEHLWGDKVNSGIGLSYRPASPCSLSGRYDNNNNDCYSTNEPHLFFSEPQLESDRVQHEMKNKGNLDVTVYFSFRETGTNSPIKGTVQGELRWVKIGINRTALKICIAGKCRLPCPKGHHHERRINILGTWRL